MALWLTLRGRDLNAIWRAMVAADYRYLLPFTMIIVATYLARVVRWGILLEPIARVPFARLNAASAVGFMAVLVLPFRLGELARPYLVADGSQLRVSAALSTIVVERVVDGLFTSLVLISTLLLVPEETSELRFVRAAGVIVFLGFSGVLGFLILAYRNRELAVSITHRLVAPLSPRFAARISDMMDAFIHGLRIIPSRKKVATFFALTAFYWGMSGYAIRVLAYGFGFNLSLVAAYAVLGVLVLGIMVPAGPGMVGTTQAAIVLGLSLFSPRQAVDTRGNAFANVLWAAQFGIQVAVALPFLWSRHVRTRGILHAAVTAELDAEEGKLQFEPGDTVLSKEHDKT